MGRSSSRKPAEGTDAEVTEIKVGDVIETPSKVASALIRLPDWSVATCRGSYTTRTPGEHAIVTTDSEGNTTEKVYNVVDPNAPTGTEGGENQ